MASKDPAEGFTAITKSAISLTTQFENLTHSIALDKVSPNHADSTASNVEISADVDPLALAHDSASLIKAHTTKLSLLIINKPFTPSAIAKVLRELVAGPIPGMASAVQICTAIKYTAVARVELAWRCHRVFKELRAFLEIIPQNGKVLPAHLKNGVKGDKGSLVSTGVVWAACDDVILLKKIGISGLLIKKVEEYRDTLQDVLDELKGWSLETDEDDEDEDKDDQDDDVQNVTDKLKDSHLSTQDMIDDLMSSQHIPRDDPDNIRERLDLCLKQLRLTTLFYSALIKRRLKSMPPLTANDAHDTAARVDKTFPLLKQLTNDYGEVALAFYDLDPDAIDKTMGACYKHATEATGPVRPKWGKQDPSDDEFSAWCQKYTSSLKEFEPNSV
ncbi:hypothetical protein F5Y16DRAFT_82490 [Xylariaceae sp. FL0255]|nr:hypothetical protein F5Y16DRAFT_82490 [Xylariaceae sp. FL0255]